MKYNKLNLTISHHLQSIFQKRGKGSFVFSHAPFVPCPLKLCKNEPCSIITPVIFIYSNESKDEDAGLRTSSPVQLEHH